MTKTGTAEKEKRTTDPYSLHYLNLYFLYTRMVIASNAFILFSMDVIVN